MATTWISKDKTKDYYGKPVTVVEGKIVEANKVTSSGTSSTSSSSATGGGGGTTTPTAVAYGGTTKDATPQQIQEAQSKGQDYYIGGKRYSSKPQVVYTEQGGVSTAFPERYQQSGVVMTEQGGVSTAYPERYTQTNKGVVMTEQGGVSTAYPERYQKTSFTNVPKTYQQREVRTRPRTTPTTTSTYRALTPEEERILKREKSKAYQFLSSTVGTAFLGEDTGQRLATGTKAQQLGAIVGIPFIFAGSGKTAASKAATKAGTALKAARATKLGKWVIGTVGVIATGEATQYGVTKGAGIFAPEEQKVFLNQPDFDKLVFAEGLRAEEEALKQQAIYKKIGNEISLFIAGNEDVYKARVTEIATQRGLTGKDKQDFINAAMRRRTTAGVAEISSLLTTSAATEILGQGLVKTGFQTLAKKKVTLQAKKSTGTLFWSGFKSIAPAGATEGATQELIQQQIRQRPTKPKDIALMGTFGAISAGILGGTIIGTKFSKPKVSKVVEIGSYLTDPYEYAGDLTARAVEKGAGKIPYIPVSTPATIFTSTPTITPSTIITFGGGSVTSTGKPTTKSATTPTTTKKSQTPALVSIKTELPQTTPTTTPTSTPTISRGRTPTPIPTDTPTVTTTPTPTPIPVPVPIPTDTPTSIPTTTPTETETPTETPTSIFTSIGTPVSVPVVTPQLRVPPPIPLMLPFGSSTGASRIGKRVKYVNEIAIGRAILKDLSTVSLFKYGKKTKAKGKATKAPKIILPKIAVPKAVKKAARKSEEEKKKKKPFVFTINKLLFG